MEAIVIRRFKCKFTRKIYVPGQIYEAAQERINFLVSAGYLEEIAPCSEKSSLSEPFQNKDILSCGSLNSIADYNACQMLTKKELEKLLIQRNIAFSKRQTKAELVNLLMSSNF